VSAQEIELLGPMFALPVFGAGGKDIKRICGTAFPIGPRVFMTASHVLETAFTHDVVAIGFPSEDRLSWRGSTITEKESLGNDISICKAAVPHADPLTWGTGKSLAIFEEVQAMGYPYGLDAQNRSIAFRGFKGHVVSEVRFAGLAERPKVYEVSFQCPRGISGAPLWLERNAEVAGVIISNAIMEMEVSSEKEIIKETNKETVLIKLEALHLGVALTAQEIIKLRSMLLEGTVGEWLTSQNLLRSP
jgi:hypothetical protein